MKLLKIIYVINGSTQTDELVASEITFQREHDTLMVRFPKSDGRVKSSTQRTRSGGLEVVSYARAEHVTLKTVS